MAMTHNVQNFISFLLQERTFPLAPDRPERRRKERKERKERTIGNYKGYLDRAVIDKPEPAPGAVRGGANGANGANGVVGGDFDDHGQREWEDDAEWGGTPSEPEPTPEPTPKPAPGSYFPEPGWKPRDPDELFPDGIGKPKPKPEPVPTPRPTPLGPTPEPTPRPTPRPIPDLTPEAPQTRRRGGDRYDISGTQVGTVGGGRIQGGINIGGDVGTYGGGRVKPIASPDGKTPQERRAEDLPPAVKQAMAADPQKASHTYNTYINHGTVVGTMGGGRISGGINIAGDVGTYGGQGGRGGVDADARSAALRSITGKSRLGSSLTSKTSDIGGKYDPRSAYLTALQRRYEK